MHTNTEHLVRHYSWELVVPKPEQAQFPKESCFMGDRSEHCAWYSAGFVSLGIDLKPKGNCDHIVGWRGRRRII